MKIAIVYSSNTGNTKIIAEAIKEELSNEDIVYFGKPENNIEADIYIVGSWTDKGNCSSEIKEFLTKLNYKKIAYFGTAGFGGQVEYYQTLFNRVKKNIYAQIIDDVNSVTLVSASSLDKAVDVKVGGNKEAAKLVGELIAKKALEKGISEVVFDRGGYVYHGRIQSLAEAAREAGLKF